MIKISMREMLEAGVHFGHRARYWNPKMAPYIYGKRHNIHIINLEESLPLFREMVHFLATVVARRGKVLFVGTKHAAREVVKEEATRCGMPYVDYRWLGGMLTNYKTIRQSIKRLKELEEMAQNEENFKGLTKKEVLTLMREKDKLSACLEGIKNMGALPDAIFVIDVGQEKIAIQEAKRLGIPVAGIVDTNCSPEGIDYMVPGNDDAIRSIHLYCKTIADAIIAARGEVELAQTKEVVEKKKEEKAVVKKIVTKKPKVEVKEGISAEPAKKAVAKKPAAKKVVAKKPAEKVAKAEKPVAKKVTTKDS